MAIRLKQGLSWIDPFGNQSSSFWGVINVNNGNKKEKKQLYCLEIYKDRATRDQVMLGESSSKPVFSQNFIVTGEGYENHFSPAAIAADRDQYHQAYLHLLGLPALGEDGEPLVDTEGNLTGDLMWGDEWETDE